jgi:epoxyqueuosine reductase
MRDTKYEMRDLAEDIKQKALELGFDLVGITDASSIETRQVELLAGWLKCGFAGQMDYMHRNFEKRVDPSKLLKNAQSVICVGLNYTPPKTQLKPPDAAALMGRVANYAQYEDYHSFIKKQLRKLTVLLSSLAGTGFKFKICVDSVPLAERALAARAGLGFIGKNHMLINPQLGAQIFLGEIITNLKLQTDQPIENACSDCQNCISACPTGALRPDGQFDANKCISYLTIEYKDQIPPDLTPKISDHLFGCDECVLACPYQKDASVCKNKQFKFYNDRAKFS